MCCDAVRYADKWYMLSLGGNICNLLGWPFDIYLDGSLTEEEFLFNTSSVYCCKAGGKRADKIMIDRC